MDPAMSPSSHVPSHQRRNTDRRQECEGESDGDRALPHIRVRQKQDMVSHPGETSVVKELEECIREHVGHKGCEGHVGEHATQGDPLAQTPGPPRGDPSQPGAHHVGKGEPHAEHECGSRQSREDIVAGPHSERIVGELATKEREQPVHEPDRQRTVETQAFPDLFELRLGQTEPHQTGDIARDQDLDQDEQNEEKQEEAADAGDDSLVTNFANRMYQSPPSFAR